MIETNLSGMGRLYSGEDDELVSPEIFDKYLENRNMEDIFFYVDNNVKNIKYLNSRFSRDILLSEVQTSGRIAYKTMEGLDLVFAHKDLVEDPKSEIKVGFGGAANILNLLDGGEDYFHLGESDAEWFVNVSQKMGLNRKYSLRQEGTSIFIRNPMKKDLAKYLKEKYNILIASSPKEPTISEINFIYNRINTTFIDSGKLAVVVNNFFSGATHEIKFF